MDEAGRGPLAGPVVAAAVILPATWYHAGLPEPWQGLNDSKQLTPEQRERYYTLITSHAEVAFAVAAVTAEVIDRINILQATHRAMRQALDALPSAPDHVLVDGRPVPDFAWPQTAIVHGDAQSYSIAAASVLAKVTRDRHMTELDQLHPGYGFALHKGYGTPAHLAALGRHGPCPVHRRTFAPLRPTQLSLLP